jgi:uncharacterized membrane protein YfcA
VVEFLEQEGFFGGQVAVDTPDVEGDPRSVDVVVRLDGQRRVRVREGALFGVSSMVGAYLGGRLSSHLPPALMVLSFGAMMLVTAAGWAAWGAAGGGRGWALRLRVRRVLRRGAGG